MAQITEEEFETEARTFLDANAKKRVVESTEWGKGNDKVALFAEKTPEQELEEVEQAKSWRQKVFDAGFAWITGPTAYGGRGLPSNYERLWGSIEAGYSTPSGAPFGIGLGMVAPTILAHATDTAKDRYLRRLWRGEIVACQLFSEPVAGSDLAGLQTKAERDGEEWVINGQKRFNSGLHHATHDIVFARTNGEPGDPIGITAFLVPTDAEGFSVDFFWWTFNMPTDHAEVTMTDVRVPATAVFGRVDHGLDLAQHFVHENRIRQAASSLGAAQFCINEAVAYANARITWGKKLSTNQGIQFPLVELHTEAAMLRQLIRSTAWSMDRRHHMEVTHVVAMCNYRANRLACEAADRAMQTCGGMGYSRHMPFEHIYRHHRRYRITEGSEEIQMRKVAQQLFGFGRK
jgi:alkylation response protein AidB-like acyl-CoA dehydrogenase